jgi:hypothetical protein
VLASLRTRQMHDDAAGSILLAVARGSQLSESRPASRRKTFGKTLERGIAGFGTAVHAGLDRLSDRAHRVVR